MSDKPMRPDQKVVFGVSPEIGTNNLIVVLQVPPGGWEYMQDGTSHTFDLTSIGVPLKILLAGCKDRADAMRVIEEANRSHGLSSLHMPGTDFGLNRKA